ncbi:hypothetical protein C0989_010559, partial [Termitomyces sp. Mn162]
MVVLLKDIWRIFSPTIEPRHQIYARLHKKRVPDDSGAYHGANIGEEKDLPRRIRQTKQLDKAINPLKLTLRTLRHYRIILEYFRFTLQEFGITRELTVVLRDASI